MSRSRVAPPVAGDKTPSQTTRPPSTTRDLNHRRSEDGANGTWTRQGGRPLDGSLRRRFEPLFGADFSNVRIHDDARSHAAAAGAHARAFTVGSHLHFRRGEFQPNHESGAQLLAHELTHTVHQRDGGSQSPSSGALRGSHRRSLEREANHAAARVVAGRSVDVKGAASAGAAPQFQLDLNDFEGGEFSIPELQTYLGVIQKNNEIEDHNDSDDKARQIVKVWRTGTDDFNLDPLAKVLLIREMQKGFTGDDDERAILNLLEYSSHADVQDIFSPNGIDPEDLDSDFQGDEEDALRAFYDREFIGGRKSALDGARALQAEKLTTISQPYSAAALKAFIAERRERVNRTIRDFAPDKRRDRAYAMVLADVEDLYTQLMTLTPDERRTAVNDILAQRTMREAQGMLMLETIEAEKNTRTKDRLTRERLVHYSEVAMLEFTADAVFRDVAMTAPKLGSKDFLKDTKKLDDAEKKAAQEAITPVTKAEMKAEAAGTTAEAPTTAANTFRETLPGELTTYGQKIAKRIPTIINDAWNQLVPGREEKDHKDKSKVYQLGELQPIMNQGKDEVDLVLSSYYNKKNFPAFQAEGRDDKNRPIKKGNLQDMWGKEEFSRKSDPSYEKAAAQFWLFYLIQNDTYAADKDNPAVGQINYAHDASPRFGEGQVGLNDEAKKIRDVALPFLKDESTRLFEIGRAWPAVHEGKVVAIQLFKDKDPHKERAFRWELLQTSVHEYLHSLASENWSNLAEQLGGEHSTEGNTLHEGVDSLLTEIVWTNVLKRAPSLEIRNKVEPDVVAAGEPFDPSLLAEMGVGRYDTYAQAMKLAHVVGITNIYVAYFQGRIDLIGQKLKKK